MFGLIIGVRAVRRTRLQSPRFQRRAVRTAHRLLAALLSEGAAEDPGGRWDCAPCSLGGKAERAHAPCCTGLDKSGKTTVLEHLKTRLSAVPGLDSDKILPTVGLNVGHLDAFGVQLLVWDLGGQAGLRSIWDKYFADSHGLVFVVDAAAPGRRVRVCLCCPSAGCASQWPAAGGTRPRLRWTRRWAAESCLARLCSSWRTSRTSLTLGPVWSFRGT